MKKITFLVLFASLLIVGCGNVSQPPKTFVTIGGQQIQTVVNGYQWSTGNHMLVADAACNPAKNLKKYNASVSEQASLLFDKKPQSMELTMWSNGTQVSKSILNGPSFTLPTIAGDYTFEVTGHWDNDYVNYDFEVQVH